MASGPPHGFASDLLKEIKSIDDYPEGLCYIIMFYETKKIRHEGDDRSRQCPGHGYPAYTESVLVTHGFVTQSEGEWKSKIAEAYEADRNRGDLIAFRMNKAKVASRVEVDIV